MATQEDGSKDDAPLIDLNEASVKKLIMKAKRRGYVTVDELNEALPQDELSSEQIEDVMSAISEMGVNIVETDEDAEAEAVSLLVERPALEAALAAATARFETDPEAAFAEQQRLLKRKLAFEKRLGLMASRRAARAAQPEIDSPVADPGTPDENHE